MEMKGFKSFAKQTELVFGEKFNCVLGPNGSGKSSAPETEVLLADGSIAQIGEIVDKEIAAASELSYLDDGVYCKNTSGLEVFTLNPDTMKIEERPVLAFAKREGEKHLYKLTTKTGKTVTTTACHPVMIFKENSVKSEIVENLSKGMRIATPRLLPIEGTDTQLDIPQNVLSQCVCDRTIQFPMHTSPALGRWLGLVIGDGYIHNARVEFINEDTDLIEEWITLSKQLFNVSLPRVRKRGKTYVAGFNSRKLPFFLASMMEKKLGFSITSARKCIPPSLLQSNQSTIVALISGLIDTDGYVSKTTPTIEFTSKNPTLVNQVQQLLLRFGILSRQASSWKCATNTVSKKKRKYTQLYIEGKTNLEKFTQIPIIHRMKRQRLYKWTSQDIQTNPNTDVLPKETNILVQEIVQELGLNVKNLRKEYPRLASYVENRCHPSREGIQIMLDLFRQRWNGLADGLRSTRKNQQNLVQTLKLANIPLSHASTSIGLQSNVVGDHWATGKFQARSGNLQLLHHHVLEEVSDRMVRADSLMRKLETLANSDIFWDEIVSIERVPGSEYVYDLCIAGNHNFVAQNIFVHNSNILDSLVFVLGKSGAKSMRAEKTANLIYNGGKSKNAAKEAVVSIYFDNKSEVFGKGFKELKLTRKVKQSGQSDYYINDAKKTRSEVVEILEKARVDPDGHNVILQGDIVHLIEMSFIERRQLIEEIAGIGVYEEKKEKALRELQRVEDKLNETQIILTERDAYLRELKSERDQAMKFKDLQDKLKRNKKTILTKKMDKHTVQKEKYESTIKKNQEQITKLTGKIEDVKKQVGVHKKAIDDINKEIERRGEKEQVALHKEVESLRVDIEVKKSRVQTLKQEIEKVKERQQNLVKTNQELFDKITYIEEEKKTIQKDLAGHEKELAQIDKRIGEFKKKHAVDDAGRLDKQIEEIDHKADALQEELSTLRAKQQTQLREKDKIDILFEQADGKIAKVLEAQKANKKQVEELKTKQQAFKQSTKELQTALSEDAGLAKQVDTARQKVSTITQELTKLRAETTAAREGSAAGMAISKILDQKSKIKGIIGTVADLGKVKQEHRLALEIAAGGRITSIVVEDDQTAQTCIEFLRKNQYGVATFLPLNKLKAPSAEKPNVSGKGVVGLATDLVEYDKRYENVFRFVLGNTLVVDTLQTARSLGIGKARFVSLQGDLADVSGAMQGGFRSTKRGGMGFQGKEAAVRLEKLEIELADQESVLARVEQKRRDNDQLIERLRGHKANLEGDIVKLEKLLHIDAGDTKMDQDEKKRLQNESKKIDKELDEIQVHLSKANKELAKMKIEKQAVREQITGMRSPEILAQLNSFEEKQQSLKDSIAELNGQLKTNDAQLTSVLGPEAERIKDITKQHDKELAGFTTEKDKLSSSLKTLEKELEAKEITEKKFLSQFRDLFKKREEAASAINKLDSEQDSHSLSIREFEIKNTNSGMELARINAELAGMQEEATQYASVEVFKSKADEDCLVEIKQFERMMEDIGAVNMKALEMYESVETEYKELVSKKEQLSVEREDVLVMINEIDSKKSDIFMKTFDVLNKNFQRIFLSLSAKGDAYLEIENPKDVFAGGVAIKVRLTGKKFMDIRSLSGGEKTMTALAFLFAVQEHEPAHFYVLDEVDAALDKHNSEKLANLVRAYCKNAQYIIISHNDSVISESDTLYGISMNEHGVSKVTTLEI